MRTLQQAWHDDDRKGTPMRPLPKTGWDRPERAKDEIPHFEATKYDRSGKPPAPKLKGGK